MRATINRIFPYFCLTFLGLWLATASVWAQDDRETAVQMVEIGDEILNQTQAYMEARYMYISAVNMDPDNIRANYMAGVTTLQTIDKGEASRYFLRVLEIDPEYSFDILYKIGRAYHYAYKFDDAIKYYQRYEQKLAAIGMTPDSEFGTKQEVERKLYECEQGKILVEFPEDVEIVNAGSAINSPSDDYAPVVNTAETLLIFTSRRQEGNLNPDVATDNYPYEDIYFANKVDSAWTDAENIKQPINTLYHDSNVGISGDGNIIYLYKDHNEGDIFRAKRDVDGNWSEPISIGKPVNTEYSETTVTVTPDGKTMFFASNRKGGFGGLDIWVTHRDKKGAWGSPENLGESINTTLDEDGPFIGYGGKTLYFSSEGGVGMGGYDIYRVSYDSLMGAWTAPENMGYPINTPDHDIYFVTTKDGKSAYFSSVREDGFGGSDVYILKIPEVLKHKEKAVKPKITLAIRLYDDAMKPVDASLKLVEDNGGNQLFEVRKGTGDYSFVSSDEEIKLYKLDVVGPGFEPQQVSITIPGVGEMSDTIVKEIFLVRVKPKEIPKAIPKVIPKVVPRVVTSSKLRNIYFSFGYSNIKADYSEMISRAVEYLNSHPSDKLLLSGHTDYIGKERFNASLSIRRAENVKKAILAQGVDSSRIMTEGLGSTHPLASNDQEREGRELNRRVEFKLLK